MSLDFQALYAGCGALAKVTALPRLVAGQAHWTSMTSRKAYSTSTPQKPTHFDGHYLRNCATLDIGVLVYIGILSHKENSPEVWHIPPGTPCIHIQALSTCIQIHKFHDKQDARAIKKKVTVYVKLFPCLP